MDPPPTIATVLASPLAAYASWHLMAHCDTCRLLSRIELQGIEAKRPGLRVVDLLARLRCRRCGGQPTSVSMRDHAPYSGRAEIIELKLLE